MSALVAFPHLHLIISGLCPVPPLSPTPQFLHVMKDYISMPVFFKGYGLSEVQAVRAKI